ncbi:M20/M25/M40 family metallo-hydrolase, partial [Clostridiaceae bacterium HSG29]|nr:M20/M25/M40 family metallo-hydrolase [Clostridiaceae bacterium HSG29]
MEFINKENVIELLSKLVKIESVYLDENEIMEYVYRLLKGSNIDAHIQEYSEKEILNYDGKNILGTIEGIEDGPIIYLNGHLDTVQITNGWATDPLDPVVKGDRLYGVGTLDMKSGVVAIILALKEFQKNHEKFKGKILYSFVSDE